MRQEQGVLASTHALSLCSILTTAPRLIEMPQIAISRTGRFRSRPTPSLSPLLTKDRSVNSDVAQVLLTEALAQRAHVALVRKLVSPAGVKMDTVWVGTFPYEYRHGAGKERA